MKKYFLIFMSVLFFNVADAQSAAMKVQKLPVVVKGDLPIDKLSASTADKISRKQISVSSSPIPMADPAREEMAKRSKPGIIKEFKTN